MRRAMSPLRFADLDSVRVVQRAPFGCYASGRTPTTRRRAPQRVAVTLLEPTSGCANHRRGLCFATSPLLACARPDPVSKQAGRRSPRRGLFKLPKPRLGSLFAAQDEPRHGREPQKPRKRLISAPRRGARRPDAGVRPSASEKGGRCTTQTLSYATALGARCTTRTSSRITARTTRQTFWNLFRSKQKPSR